MGDLIPSLLPSPPNPQIYGKREQTMEWFKYSTDLVQKLETQTIYVYCTCRHIHPNENTLSITLYLEPNIHSLAIKK